MYCVIQEVRRKKPNQYGAYKEIEAYQDSWTIEGKPPAWSWQYTGGRFERPHLEAYKITLHQSYRENGAVRKRQYTVCTMSYYDICESWYGDCIAGGVEAVADRIGIDAAELCKIIDAKMEPLRERIEAEYHQSAEYIAEQEHERIKKAYWSAQSDFCKKYGVDKSDYDRCYDVFGTLRNKEYLTEIKARQQAEREARKRFRESWRSYQESWYGTYSGQSSGSYSAPPSSTYTEEETAILKKFYRSLSKTYHPDLNPGRDTTAEMQLLNKLKAVWGV